MLNPIEWSDELKECCHKYSIEYFSAPYDQELSVKLRDYSNIVKVGSGEITWIEHLKLLNKIYDFVIVATGASDILDVKRAIEVFKEKKYTNAMYTNYMRIFRDFRGKNSKI